MGMILSIAVRDQQRGIRNIRLIRARKYCKMSLKPEALLCPKIEKHCLSLWQSGFYKHAAHEAMIQVERALKEKGMIQENDKRFGRTLVSSLLKFGGKEKSVRLRVPLGDELQEYAEAYFQGVFSYYRNYTAHDGSKIDEFTSMRVMIIASELLDLIDASSLSFAEVGGIEGLVRVGPFPSKEHLLNLLLVLSNRYVPDGATDGVLEELMDNYGLTERHMDAAIELDLVRYSETEYTSLPDELRVCWQDSSPPDSLGHFQVTELGEVTIAEIRKSLDEQR